MTAELAYPPIHEHETYRFIHRVWDVAAAWRFITPDREPGWVNVPDYYRQYLADNLRLQLDHSGQRPLTGHQHQL